MLYCFKCGTFSRSVCVTISSLILLRVVESLIPVDVVELTALIICHVVVKRLENVVIVVARRPSALG